MFKVKGCYARQDKGDGKDISERHPGTSQFMEPVPGGRASTLPAPKWIRSPA